MQMGWETLVVLRMGKIIITTMLAGEFHCLGVQILVDFYHVVSRNGIFSCGTIGD